MSDVRGKLLPVYFVPDESGSMAPNMTELNTSLRNLHDHISDEPDVAAMIRFSIVGFSDQAIEHLSLVDLREVNAMPTLTARAGTSYAAAFTDLRSRIEVDAERLKNDGFLVHRAVVFFLSDGQPTDQEPVWKEALSRLKGADFKYRPNVFAFGFRDATPGTILEVASHQNFAYVMARESSPSSALAEFFTTLTQSLVVSSQALAAGVPPPPFKKPDGYDYAYDLV